MLWDQVGAVKKRIQELYLEHANVQKTKNKMFNTFWKLEDIT
jgi:hypothetical protein